MSLKRSSTKKKSKKTMFESYINCITIIGHHTRAPFRHRCSSSEEEFEFICKKSSKKKATEWVRLSYTVVMDVAEPAPIYVLMQTWSWPMMMACMMFMAIQKD